MNTYKYSDLKIGMTEEFYIIDGKAIEITESCIKNFCALTGDSSPIHVDSQYAKERGFQGKVCYGMLTASFYSTLVGVYLPGKYALLQEARISMTKPVYVGDQLRILGKIIRMNDVFQRITIKARIINQKNEVVSRATLEAGVSE